MFVKVYEYKGRPVITLLRSEDDIFPFSFGIEKAKMIIAAIEHIKSFVAKYSEN